MTCTTSTNLIGCVNAQGCKCSCTPCKCSVSGAASPVPYYNQAIASQEPHCCPTINQCYALAINSSTDFIVPSCNQETIVTFPNICNVQVNSYLWNADVGYLAVTDVNYLTGQLTLTNLCSSGNASPGTLVTAGTQFSLAAQGVIAGWKDWTPTLSSIGTMTFTDVIIHTARYYTLPGIVFYKFRISCTTATADAVSIKVSLPVTAAPIPIPAVSSGAGYVVVPGVASLIADGTLAASDLDNLYVYIFDQRLIGLQANTGLSIAGFYEV